MLFCGFFNSFWGQMWAGGGIRWPNHGAGPTSNIDVAQKRDVGCMVKKMHIVMCNLILKMYHM